MKIRIIHTTGEHGIVAVDGSILDYSHNPEFARVLIDSGEAEEVTESVEEVAAVSQGEKAIRRGRSR